VNKRTLACVFLREQVLLEPPRFEALVLKFGGPEFIWDAPPAVLRGCGLLSNPQVERLLKKRDQAEAISARLDALSKLGIHTVSCFDDDFPAPLLSSFLYPPSFLYRQGTDGFSGPHLLVAGALQADVPEIAAAVAVGKRLASLGAVLVSTFAEGVEAAAHVGVLSGSGRHKIFLACGHHAATARDEAVVLAKVAEAGAVYSEYAPEVEPTAKQRAAASRLALGAAQGVLVLGEVDAHMEAAVAEAGAAGKPIFYLVGTEAPVAESLRREGAYPVAGPENLDRILPFL
jgi:DNA processing protein